MTPAFSACGASRFRPSTVFAAPVVEQRYALDGGGSGTFLVGTLTAVSFTAVENLTGGTGTDTIVLPAQSSVRFTGSTSATVRDSFNELLANVGGVESFDGSAGEVTYSTDVDSTIATLTMDTDDRLVVETALRLAEWEKDQTIPPQQHMDLLRRTFAALAQPI